MKTVQEINNIRGAITACRKNVTNYTEKLEASRKELYGHIITLFKYQNDLEVGDTVSWEWFIDKDKYGFECLDETFIDEPIGEIESFNYTDYTGIQLIIKRGQLSVILGNKMSVIKDGKTIKLTNEIHHNNNSY